MYIFNMSPFIEPLNESRHLGRLNLRDTSGFTGSFYGYSKLSNSDWVPVIIIPLLAAVILTASVFLLIIFRQNPTFVITAVAGCLIFIAVYLMLSALESTNRITYQ